MNVYAVQLEGDVEYATAETMAEAWTLLVDEIGHHEDDIQSITLLGSVWLGPASDD